MNKQNTISLVREWGVDKGIIGENAKATQYSQFNKLIEEVSELRAAIDEDNEAEKIDAVGDCTVVLILLSELIGTPFEECLEAAYGVISKRKGKMVNGMFVKEEA